MADPELPTPPLTAPPGGSVAKLLKASGAIGEGAGIGGTGRPVRPGPYCAGTLAGSLGAKEGSTGGANGVAGTMGGGYMGGMSV